LEIFSKARMGGMQFGATNSGVLPPPERGRVGVG
jgi:hypothetical protein